jgi:cytochrome c oxidase subunit I+III
LMDAEPDYKSILPAPSIWPFLLALAVSVAFIGVIFDVIWVPIGAALSLGAFIGWHWPVSREQSRDREEREEA